MKYFIHINAFMSVEWGLTLSEASVYDWMRGLAGWANTIQIQEDTFYFASRNKACEDLPMVTDKTDTMYRHYKTLEKKGLIKHEKVGDKDYVCFDKSKAQAWDNNNSDDDSGANTGLGNKSEGSRNEIRDTSEINPTNNTISNYNIRNKKNNPPIPPKEKSANGIVTDTQAQVLEKEVATAEAADGEDEIPEIIRHFRPSKYHSLKLAEKRYAFKAENAKHYRTLWNYLRAFRDSPIDPDKSDQQKAMERHVWDATFGMFEKKDKYFRPWIEKHPTGRFVNEVMEKFIYLFVAKRLEANEPVIGVNQFQVSASFEKYFKKEPGIFREYSSLHQYHY